MGTQQDNKMRLVLLLPVLVLVAVAAADNKGPAVYDNERLLFGSYKTTTYTVVSASTSTVYYSCLSGTYSALICKGRKRKSVRGMKDLSTPVEDMMLDSSGDAGSEDVKQLDNNTNNSNQKFGFTVWTTSKTTTSITVMYTNTASTLRISYYCAAGGINFPTNPC